MVENSEVVWRRCFRSLSLSEFLPPHTFEIRVLTWSGMEGRREERGRRKEGRETERQRDTERDGDR